MKQPLATVRLHRPITLSPDTDEVEIDLGGYHAKLPVTKSSKKALAWLQQQNQSAPISGLREQLDTESDCHFGILQVAGFILKNLVLVGVTCPQNRLLAEIEYSNMGTLLPDMSNPQELAEDKKITLSRFCYIHREDDQLLLSMPLKDKRFVIREKAMQKLLFELAFGTNLQQIRFVCDSDNDLFAGFCCLINILYNAGFVIAVKDNSSHLPTRLEEGDSAMQQWDFHDLLSHANSRLGYNYGQDFGGAFPFVNLIDPQPAIRVVPKGERIALYKPDLQHLATQDKSLTDLIIQRISMRAYDEESPISLKEIGEFFFRTGRVLYENNAQVTSLRNPEQHTEIAFAWRPYPTGGASYELEFYLTVDRAEGINPGMYYYAPGTHELVKLSDKNVYTEGLINVAYTSCARIVKPQVVVHIAARFQRVSWKYHNIAYSTMLRNTGVVYQTFYLHATAMGLAGCGLGSGSTELFCRATGNAPHVECNVGEFMLGSLPKGFDLGNLDLPASALAHDAKLSPTAY